LIRIDDIDQARAIVGVDKFILEQLEQLGLFWDEDVVYQSQRLDLYQTALEQLECLKYTYPCTCTRKDLSDKAYSGTCQNGIRSGDIAYSIRIKTNDDRIGIYDQLHGDYTQCLESHIGDFIIKRADGFFAYHLAVVVDDAEQEITDIVRGVDLLDSTPRQVYLQHKLNLFTPSYLHLPIVVDMAGEKISKTTQAEAVNSKKPNEVLHHALNFLGQAPPRELLNENIESILKWAVQNWDTHDLPKQKEIPVNINIYSNQT